jgi:hypothetical protein
MTRAGFFALTEMISAELHLVERARARYRPLARWRRQRAFVPVRGGCAILLNPGDLSPKFLTASTAFRRNDVRFLFSHGKINRDAQR